MVLWVMLEAPDRAQSFIFCAQIMTEKINVMFLLVNNFKMIGMLLNVVHRQVQQSWQKPVTKGFPTTPL